MADDEKGVKRWHVRANGEMGPCKAKTASSCPFAGEEGTVHFTDKAKAQEYSEQCIKLANMAQGFRMMLKKGVQKPEEAERITGLAKPESPFTTSLDPNGSSDHSTEVIWDPDMSASQKATGLLYRYGYGWMKNHADKEERRAKLAEAVRNYVGSSKGKYVEDSSDDFMASDDIDVRVAFLKPDGTLDDGESIEGISSDALRLSSGLYTRIAGNGASKRPLAIAVRFDKDGNRVGPPTLLTTGMKNTRRSLFGRNNIGGRARIAAQYCDNGRGYNVKVHSYGLLLNTPTWTTYDDRSGLGKKTYQINADSLIGYDALRKSTMESTGIDIKQYAMQTDDTDTQSKRLNDIEEHFDELANEEVLAKYQSDYEYNQKHGKIANAFTDKIHTSVAAENAAKSTSLHNEFKHIEFDEDMDLAKLPQLEGEISVAMRHLPKTTKDIDTFRVRKLGKYRGNTMGLYSPEYNAIVLDDGKATRMGYSGMSAFIHEYAHHIDHTMEDGRMMSMSPEFRPVLSAINNEVNSIKEISPSFSEYLKTPTEVFSRCFEYWASQKLGVKSSLLATNEEYGSSTINYRGFDKHADLIDKVMSKMFPEMKTFNTLDKDQWNK